MRSRTYSGQSGQSTFALVVVVIVMIGLVVLFWWQYSNRPEAIPAALTVTVPIPPLRAGEASTFYAHIKNDGGDAHDVYLQLESLALASYTQPRVEVGGGSSENIEIQVRADDVNNQLYEVIFRLHYRDVTGPQTKNVTGQVYVLPLVEIVEFDWEATGPLGLQRKSIIGRSDQTSFHFRVLSSSDSAVYGGIVAKAQFETEAPDLTISPSSMPVERLGPHGKSEEYIFNITSNGASPGDYRITILLFSDQSFVTKHTVVLTVSS